MMPSSMLIFQQTFLAYLISEKWVWYLFRKVGSYINTQGPSHLFTKQRLQISFIWMCLVQMHSPCDHRQVTCGCGGPGNVMH